MALERIENIAGIGDNAGVQHFLLSPQCFQKSSLTWSLKVEINVKAFIHYKSLKTAESKQEDHLSVHGIMELIKYKVKNRGNRYYHLIAWRFLTVLLTRYKMTNSRLFQTERVCRRQFQI